MRRVRGDNVRKTIFACLLALVILTGCGGRRAPQYKNAAAHLGDPRVVQIIPAGQAPAAVSDREDVDTIMGILNEVEVRQLSVEEELDMVVTKGSMLDATELRFKDNKDSVYRALLLTDGSLLVVEGEMGGNGQRRDVFLSAPNQRLLLDEIAKHLGSGLTN